MKSFSKPGRLLLLPLLLAGSLALAQAEPSEGKAAEKPVKAATDDPTYVIGALDVVNISVWKEPELSAEVPVRPDGKISLPLLDDVQAAGLKPMKLAEAITESLRKYVSEPRVTVVVTQVNSKRYYILGEVGRPGAFPLLPRMTVLQALSSAGGFSQFANLRNIYVLRQAEDGKQVKMPFNYRDVLRGNRPEQNILLEPGDTIIVP